VSLGNILVGMGLRDRRGAMKRWSKAGCLRLGAEVHHGLLCGAALLNNEPSGYPGSAKHELAVRSTCRSGAPALAHVCMHRNGHQ
jgi:hypothetical protein